jgi:hypothetical protein
MNITFARRCHFKHMFARVSASGRQWPAIKDRHRERRGPEREG